MRTAQQNQLTFAPSHGGYTVQTGSTQYGVPTSTAGPLPDKNAFAPPPYSAHTNGGYYGGPEGGSAAYLPGPQGYAPYPQAGAAVPPAGAMGNNMVNPPPYHESSTAPHQPPQQK